MINVFHSIIRQKNFKIKLSKLDSLECEYIYNKKCWNAKMECQ